MTQYILWHTQRQGWFTRMGTTSTIMAEAMIVDREDALRRVKRAVQHDGVLHLIPVALVDVEGVAP